MRVAAFIFSLLIVGPVAAAYDGNARTHQKAPVLRDDATALCAELIEKARAIDALLHTVTDKAGADAAAVELEKHLADMQALLLALEQLPFDVETTNVITTQMTALTHITQAYMPLIQQLQENQAYGSQSLMTQLRKHNEDNGYAEPSVEPIELTPFEQLCCKLEENLGNALYAVRKTTDAATAKDAVLSLSELKDERNVLVEQMEILASQGDSDTKSTAHLSTVQQLKTELQTELNRLQELRFYDDPDLPALLPEYINLIP